MSHDNTWVTEGVVLSRRPYGEFDLIAVLYTEALGKIQGRFIGVRRPKGKLKALAEPMVHGEYRLYARPASEWASVTGGRILDCFPGVRGDLDRTCRGLRLCELLQRLAPDRAPNPRKLELIVEFMKAIERSPSPWLSAAFGLRLLESAGFGLSRRPPEGIAGGLWSALHEGSLAELERAPDAEGPRERVQARLEQAFQELFERPLATTLFETSLRRARLSPGGLARRGRVEEAPA